jgi:hypothetical protein
VFSFHWQELTLPFPIIIRRITRLHMYFVGVGGPILPRVSNVPVLLPQDPMPHARLQCAYSPPYDVTIEGERKPFPGLRVQTWLAESRFIVNAWTPKCSYEIGQGVRRVAIEFLELIKYHLIVRQRKRVSPVPESDRALLNRYSLWTSDQQCARTMR